MLIQCLIEREGPTFVAYNGKRYDFELNRNGHYVCNVANPGAVSYFLDTLAGGFYQEYVLEEKPEEVVEKVERAETKEAMKKRYSAMKSKDEVEKACLDDFGVDLNKKFGLGKLKSQVYALIDKE